VVDNPQPGARVTPGKLAMSGVDFDAAARDATSGVDRVSVFLDDRDRGGAHLGTATPASRRWTVTTATINGFGEQRTVFVYARSSETGLETVVQIPVVIGEEVEEG
jgi:hypothetical protein